MAKAVEIVSWYRLELDDEGKVLTCRAVEMAGTDNGGVFFVRAKSEKAAGKAAFNAYYKLRLRARRAKLRAEGKCDCGRQRDIPGRVMCSACTKLNRASHDRKRARERGEDVPVPDKSETLRRRREAERQEIRLETLREALRFYLANPKGFIARMQAEIAKLAGKDAA